MNNRFPSILIKAKFLMVFCFFTLSAFSQSQSEIYSTVGISMDDFKKLVADPTHGLAIDHFHKNEDRLLEFVFSQSELQLLRARAISYEVIISDYKSHFKALASTAVISRSSDLENFDLGEMGGYHTYDEMVAHITSMESLYGDIVNISTIGQSIEGRDIWSVKISDNPDLDESSLEGVVYYEALTHAREPMSLEVTLYYMWWLLENSATNDEAAYLINNREIYFVPIVNPDGYVYNETTDPNGGGLWRKNRFNAGNGCFGVDLNRNYPKGWGLDSGSSNDPCTQTYRGESPFSEPESRAVRDFVAEINPSIAFSSHAFGDKFLSPWGYVDSLASYDLYAEFVSEFIPPMYDGYGTTAKMLDYTSSGTTRDYLHTQDVLAWVPEIGHSFWESPTVICDRAEEFLVAMKYLTWVSGEYACFHDFTLTDADVSLGETIGLDIRIKNRGLTQAAVDTRVSISTDHSAINVLNGEESYGTIPARQYDESNGAPFKFEIIEPLNPGELIPFTVEVYADNTLSYRKEIYITAGQEDVLYQDDFEMNSAWLSPSITWDSCSMDGVSGFHSFVDSREGNYLANSNVMVVMNESVDLSATSNPYVSFNAKWSIEPSFDFVKFMVSTNGIDNWVSMSGLYSDFLDRYMMNSHWVQERIDLSPFIGEPTLYFAFQLQSDNSVHSDGIYIDDFKVADYTESLVNLVEDHTTALSGLHLVPNPSSEESVLYVTSEKGMNAELKLLALNGRQFSEKTIKLIPGMNRIPLDLKLMPSGMYLVQVYSDLGLDQLKLVVD